MTIIDIPVVGSATRDSWLTNGSPGVFRDPTGNFAYPPLGGTTVYGNITSPSVIAPHTFIMDFQTAMTLEIMSWKSDGTAYSVPSDMEVYGSATGLFAGEEVLVKTFTGVTRGTVDDETVYYDINSAAAYRYYQFSVSVYCCDASRDYFYRFNGLSFTFADGENTKNLTTEYVEPANKIVGSDGWTYTRRTMDYGSYATENNFFNLAFEFIEDRGWTLEQLIEFPRSFILSSQGKNGDQPKAYWKFLLAGSTISVTNMYGYWDKATMTGTLEANHTSTSFLEYERVNWNNVALDLQFVGNEDLITIFSVYYYTNNYGYTAFGRLPEDTNFRPALTTLVNTQVAGAGVNIEVPSSSGFEVGSYYCFWGANGEGRDHGVLCTAIPDSTHVTVDTVPRDYSAGSFIGTFPQTAFFHSNAWYHLGQRNVSGLLPSTDFFGAGQYLQYNDPAGAIGKFALFPMMWREAQGVDYGLIGGSNHFAQRIPNTSELDIYLVGSDTGSTATSAGVKTLTDTTKTWTVDEHAGRMVHISAGTGYDSDGSFYEIASNTVDTLTISYDWITQPVATDTYFITDEVWWHAPPPVSMNDMGSIKMGG